jgi:ribosomal protein S18 acetylase RimI-like enzyme
MPVSVRPATVADAPVLAEVAAATFALACPPHVTQQSVETFIRTVLSEQCFEEYLADDQRDLLLAEDEAGPLGYAMVVAGEPADDDVRSALTRLPAVELSKIYVLPRSHGTGAAGELMAAALARASRRGAAGVWLGVNQLNERAQRFYSKSGFALVGTKRFLVGDRYEDDFVYERRLDDGQAP